MYHRLSSTPFRIVLEDNTLRGSFIIAPGDGACMFLYSISDGDDDHIFRIPFEVSYIPSRFECSSWIICVPRDAISAKANLGYM